MSKTNVPIVFRVFRGDVLCKEETLAQPVIKIGKLSSSQLRLEDDAVSRMHAVIERTPSGEIHLVDLGSTGGTFVNGHKVSRTRLRSGDHVTMGQTRIEITIPGSETPRPVPPAPAMARPHAPTVTPPAVPRSAPPIPAASPASPTPAQPMFATTTPGDTDGARAIEIAAMLGDSVVGVTHLIDPKSGTITRRTWAAIALGALFLLLAATGFSAGVRNAAFNKHSKDEWTRAELPAHEWRPRRISLAYDWMAMGGATGGLMLLTLGLMRLRSERRSPYFRIGSDRSVEFATADAPAPAFPLVGPRGNDFALTFTRDMDGEMNAQGRRATLKELCAQGLAQMSEKVAGAFELAIPAQARIKVSAGKTQFLISSVAAPRRQAVPLFGSIERRVVAFGAGSAIVHMGLWALLNTIPPDPQALALDLGGAEARTARIQTKPNEPPAAEEKTPEEGGGGEGEAMKDDPGKMGTKEATNKEGRAKVKNTGREPQISKKDATEQAATAGLVGAMRKSEGFNTLVATGDFTSGMEDASVFGGLLGDEALAVNGTGGFGTGGNRFGGGGTGTGTFGTGRYGTIGYQDGAWPGSGIGARPGPTRNRKAGAPAVRIGEATQSDGLDRSIIRRYVRGVLPRIRHCYEKQLTVHPGLAGTVMSQFRINPQGAVISSTASGVHEDVSSCVADVVKTIRFPKPNQNTLVEVNYPFTFRPTGG